MSHPQRSSRYALIEESRGEHRDSFANAVLEGLRSDPKSLPCRFLYDEVGSELFEEICELPEYYLTRSEHEILERHADAIVAACPSPLTLAELGSGSSTKTRLLIEALLRRQHRLRYVPVDISRSMLDDSARTLLADYEGLEILAIAGEYGKGLRHVGEETRTPKLIAWLGSNIGNFPRSEARQFVRNLRDAMRPDDRLLLGIDLRKDAAALEDAYDDPQGLTARFNKNLLARINRELGGRFDLEGWSHRAHVHDGGGRVELGVVSERACTVRIDALERSFRFGAGEFVHTEDSYKYSPEEVDALAAQASLAVDRRWLDTSGRFSLNLLAPR